MARAAWKVTAHNSTYFNCDRSKIIVLHVLARADICLNYKLHTKTSTCWTHFLRADNTITLFGTISGLLPARKICEHPIWACLMLRARSVGHPALIYLARDPTEGGSVPSKSPRLLGILRG
jgi:hypothetical protein